MWQLLAKLLARPKIRDWLIRRSFDTPYTVIQSADGQDIYMERFWLFNAAERPFLPSIRIHFIHRTDADRHEHDHPWNARTFILAGTYVEQRDGVEYIRRTGTSARLNRGEFHKITYLSYAPVVTLFVTWGRRSDWYFNVDGEAVPHLEYLANE
jgi:hypothetical protein